MKNDNLFLQLFANCIVVRGAKMSLVMDLQRHKIFRFSSDWLSILNSINQKAYSKLYAEYDKDNQSHLSELKDFIINNDIGFFTDIPNQFPAIKFIWDTPQRFTNAIIDIKNEIDYVPIALKKFDLINCKHIQIRFFSEYSFEQIKLILNEANKYEFFSIEIIIQYSNELSEGKVKELFTVNPALYLCTIPNSPETKRIKIGSKEIKLQEICYLTQQISDEDACGKTNISSFSIPHISLFSERLHCNSCLNRKISVDSKGMVKNCPSLKQDFGHINNCDLHIIANNDEFCKLEKICKDHIAICKDCEYRYLCIDCRAYTINNSLLSKPSKCNYNPYLALWE